MDGRNTSFQQVISRKHGLWSYELQMGQNGERVCLGTRTHARTHSYRKHTVHTGIHPHAYKVGTHTIQTYTLAHICTHFYRYTHPHLHAHTHVHISTDTCNIQNCNSETYSSTLMYTVPTYHMLHI